MRYFRIKIRKSPNNGVGPMAGVAGPSGARAVSAPSLYATTQMQFPCIIQGLTSGTLCSTKNASEQTGVVQCRHFTPELLQLPYAHGNMYTLQQIHPGLTAAQCSLLSTIQSRLCCYRLPDNIRETQMQMLRSRFSACAVTCANVHHLTFCILCAINGKQFSSKMRTCTETGQTYCVNCAAGTVIRVNMLGTLLRLCDRSYYLCNGCGALCEWDGTSVLSAALLCHRPIIAVDPDRGQPQQPPCCDVCGQKRPVSISTMGWTHVSSSSSSSRGGRNNNAANAAAYTGADTTPHSCLVCGSKHVYQSEVIFLPDLQRKGICRIRFCGRHSPPRHMLSMMYNTHDLVRYLLETASGRAAAVTGGAGGNSCRALKQGARRRPHDVRT